MKKFEQVSYIVNGKLSLISLSEQLNSDLFIERRMRSGHLYGNNITEILKKEISDEYKLM